MRDKYIITSFIIKFLISLVILMAINIAAIKFLNISYVIHIVVTLILLIIDTLLLIVKMKYLKTFKYQLDNNNINITRGVFVKRFEKFPIRRIQHVRYEQYLIQRQFNIASVIAITSGEMGVIEMLTLEEAKELVDNINSSLNLKLDEES